MAYCKATELILDSILSSSTVQESLYGRDKLSLSPCVENMPPSAEVQKIPLTGEDLRESHPRTLELRELVIPTKPFGTKRLYYLDDISEDIQDLWDRYWGDRIRNLLRTSGAQSWIAQVVRLGKSAEDRHPSLLIRCGKEGDPKLIKKESKKHPWQQLLAELNQYDLRKYIVFDPDLAHLVFKESTASAVLTSASHFDTSSSKRGLASYDHSSIGYVSLRSQPGGPLYSPGIGVEASEGRIYTNLSSPFCFGIGYWAKTLRDPYSQFVTPVGITEPPYRPPGPHQYEPEPKFLTQKGLGQVQTSSTQAQGSLTPYEKETRRVSLSTGPRAHIYVESSFMGSRVIITEDSIDEQQHKKVNRLPSGRLATVSCLVKFHSGTTVYALTVGHRIFDSGNNLEQSYSTKQLEANSDSSSSDDEWDSISSGSVTSQFASYNRTSSHDLFQPTGYSMGSTDGKSTLRDDMLIRRLNTVSSLYNNSIQAYCFGYWAFERGAFLELKNTSDWCLIPLVKPLDKKTIDICKTLPVQEFHRFELEKTISAKDVYFCKATSGVHSARLTSGVVQARFNGVELKLMEVWLSTPLEPGDSGSPVYANDVLYGIFIAGSKATCTAYMIPIRSICESIGEYHGDLTGPRLLLADSHELVQSFQHQKYSMSKVRKPQSLPLKAWIDEPLHRGPWSLLAVRLEAVY